MSDLFFCGSGPGGVVSLEDGFPGFFVGPALLPTEPPGVPGPLEVGHDHPAGIDQDIRQNRDTPWLRIRSASGVIG